jgi:hypothetical protein
MKANIAKGKKDVEYYISMWQQRLGNYISLGHVLDTAAADSPRTRPGGAAAALQARVDAPAGKADAAGVRNRDGERTVAEPVVAETVPPPPSSRSIY